MRRHEARHSFLKIATHDVDAALPHLQKAAQLAPQDARPHVALAHMHYRKKDFSAAEAEARLREEADVLRERARGYYDTARVRGQEYYDEASERFDEAQRYLVERVQERPMQSTAIALGVGVVLGLLLAGRRR